MTQIYADSKTQTSNHIHTMKTKIILPLITIALLLAACDRQPVGKPATKAAVPAKFDPNTITDEMFTISRNGEKVTIRWDADFSACKGVRIYRNATGRIQNRETVVRLPATSKEYVDSAPDARAWWYWVSIALRDGKYKAFGPMRSPVDDGNTGNYARADDGAQLIIRRTENAAVVAWDLPDVKYKEIEIMRGSSPVHQWKRSPRKAVHKTLEFRGDFIDQVPDAEADYWYWIEATKATGEVITKGPIKAEFGAK